MHFGTKNILKINFNHTSKQRKIIHYDIKNKNKDHVNFNVIYQLIHIV